MEEIDAVEIRRAFSEGTLPVVNFYTSVKSRFWSSSSASSSSSSSAADQIVEFFSRLRSVLRRDARRAGRLPTISRSILNRVTTTACAILVGVRSTALREYLYRSTEFLVLFRTRTRR